MSHHEIHKNTTSSLEEKLAGPVEALKANTSKHPDWSLFENQILEKMTSTTAEKSQPSFIGYFHPAYWLTTHKLGFAASMVGALLVTIILVTGSTQSSFANVLNHIKQMNSLIMTSTVKVSPNMYNQVTVFYNAPGQSRTEVKTLLDEEVFSSVTTITDLSLAKSIVLIPAANMAMAIQLGQQASSEHYPLLWLEELRSIPADDYIDLGERYIDANLANGYQVNTDGFQVTIWADQQTSIPLTFNVQSIEGHPNAIEDFSVNGDVQLNPELDLELFNLSIPDGYQVNHVDATIKGILKKAL